LTKTIKNPSKNFLICFRQPLFLFLRVLEHGENDKNKKKNIQGMNFFLPNPSLNTISKSFSVICVDKSSAVHQKHATILVDGRKNRRKSAQLRASRPFSVPPEFSFFLASKIFVCFRP
jgi:hypothetical protein